MKLADLKWQVDHILADSPENADAEIVFENKQHGRYFVSAVTLVVEDGERSVHLDETSDQID